MSTNGTSPPSSPSPSDLERLSAAVPLAVIPVERQQGDDVLVIDVASIRNPTLQGHYLDVSLVASVGGEAVSEAIGRVTPYPPDQASSYVLRLSARALALLDEDTGDPSVEVRLAPIDAATPLASDIALTVSIRLERVETLGG